MARIKLLASGARKHWFRAAIALGVAALLLGNHGFRRLLAHSFELRSLRSELTALRLEEKDLKSSIEAAKNDDRALERVARKELGYLKPGEVEYRFPPPQPQGAP